MKTQNLSLNTSQGYSIPSVSLRYPYRKIVVLLAMVLLGVGQVWAAWYVQGTGTGLNGWGGGAQMTQVSGTDIYYRAVTGSCEFKITSNSSGYNDERNSGHIENSLGNVTLSGNGNITSSQSGNWYICYDDSKTKVYGSTTQPSASGSGGGSSLDVQIRGFMNSWGCTAMTQVTGTTIYYYEATSNGDFKVTNGCNWDNEKNLSYYDNSKGNVTLSGDNHGGNITSSQTGTYYYICFDSSDNKVYATTNDPTSSGISPSVSIVANPTTAATGENITFTATGSNLGGKSATYKFEDVTSGTTTLQNASTTVTCTTSWATAGTKTVKVTMTVDSKTYTAQTTVTIQTKTTIYFDNSLTKWSKVYLYLYSKNYWDSTKGTGSESGSGCYAQHLSMSLVSGSSTIYSYTYTGDVPAYVAFGSASQDGYGYFYDVKTGGFIYKQFSASTPLWIPSNTTTKKYNEANSTYTQYYENGEWSVYPPVPTISFDASSSTINLGATASIKVNASNAEGATVSLKYNNSEIASGTVSGGSVTLSYTPTTYIASRSLSATMTVSGTTYTASDYTLKMNTPAATLEATNNPVVANASTTLTVGYSNISTDHATIKYQIDDVTSGTTNLLAKGTTKTKSTSWATAGTKKVRATVYVTVTGGSELKYTKDLEITVSEPVPTIEYATTSSTINLGGSVTLTVNTSNVSSGSTVTFYTTTSTSSTTESTTLGISTTNASGVATYTYTPKSYAAKTYIGAKVGSTRTATNYTLSMNTPSVTLAVDKSSAGIGDNVKFTATASNVGSGATITYNFKTSSSGGAVQSTTSNTYTTSWNTSGTKTIYVTITVQVSGGTAYTTTATVSKSVTITAPITVYFSNEQCWDEVYLHFFDITGSGASATTWPGTKLSQDANGWYSYTFPATVTKVSVIFNNSNGSQTNDITGVTATTYYKMGSDRNYSTTNSSYTPAACVPDVYTVVGMEEWLGSYWDTNDANNEMTWNDGQGRYELRKVNVAINNNWTYYYKIVKNHDYGQGEWPSSGNANYSFGNSAGGNKDLLFWFKLNDGGAWGVEVYDAATYTLNHPWDSGSWTQKTMTYNGNNEYIVAGIFGANGADVLRNGTKVQYFEPNSISGYNNVSAGDNVVFTYNASNNTLSVSCPTCANVTNYYIRISSGCSGYTEAMYKMDYLEESGLYRSPAATKFYYKSNGAEVGSSSIQGQNRWRGADEIVGSSGITECTEVVYYYDPVIDQLSVVDATKPQVILTATQEVNAAATQSEITLKTTCSKTLTNATYTYTLLSGPASGTWGANPAATTTFETTTEGTYKFQVTVSATEGTFTATCTVKVKFKIVVFAHVGAPNWSTAYLHYYNSDVNETTQMSNVGGKWYKLEVVGVPEFTFNVYGNSTGSGNNQTVNIGPIDDDICVIVESETGDYSNRRYHTTNDCALYERFASTYTQMKGEQTTGKEKTVYSNYFKKDGDEVSFYVGTTVKHQTFNSTTNKWNDGTKINGLTTGDVYAGQYDASASTKLKNWKVYDGDFYIRTDGAPGGWNNYVRDDQAFFQFSENAFFPGEWYNHYWCKWLDGGNVKAVVGNEINPALTDTLPDFTLTVGTSMRFEYDNSTNYIGRQFLKGSTNASDKFLQIYCDNDGYIYNGSQRLDEDHKLLFNDGSDWVYLIDVTAKKTKTEDVTCYVLGRYPVNKDGISTGKDDQANYLGGYENDGVTPKKIKIMGSKTENGNYSMRLIYDYKTNRLMAVWYPQGNEIEANTNIDIDANFMMSRTDDDDAKTVKIKNNISIMSINQMVSTLTITKEQYDKKKNNGVYFYWVSLPYDCRVRDIYGIGSYGKKWTVQRYRGDMRAKYGYRHDITTFWANMKQNATATMEANRGYVIRVQLTDADFKEINNISQVTLYFPSCNTETMTLSYDPNTKLQTSVPKYECKIVEPISDKERKNWDSNWNVIGNPGMATMEITSPTELTDDDPDAQKEKDGDNSLNYYYQWDYNGVSSSSNYTVKAVANQNIFRAMYSYMTQYEGTLVWQPQIKTSERNQIIRRVEKSEQKDVLIEVALKDASETQDDETTDGIYDRTYITLREGAAAEFTLNQDLAKMGNDAPMIYSVFDDVETAGKVLPFETSEIPLTVVVPKVDEYLVENGIKAQPEDFVISLENNPNKTITFVDYKEDREVVLNGNSYSVSLTPGTYSGRFALRISERSEVVTSLGGSATAMRILTNGQTIHFEGITEPTDVRIYDVMGRCLFSRTVMSGEQFEAPAMGVYLIQANGKTDKIVIE